MIELFILSLIFLFLGHFIIVLSKVNFSFSGAINWHKKKLKKLLSEQKKKRVTSSKKEMQVKDSIEEKEDRYGKIIPEDIDNLDLDSVFPFKVLDSKDMSRAEQELRFNLIKKVKERPSYFIENGEKKLIVPLEAIVFLNKDLNPLVNEYGQIVIRIEEKNQANLTKYKIVLEDTGEVLFENNDNVMQALKELDKISKSQNISIEEINELLKEKIEKRNREEKEEELPKYLQKEEVLSQEENEIEEEESEIKTEEVLSSEDLEELMLEELAQEEDTKVTSMESLVEDFDTEVAEEEEKALLPEDIEEESPLEEDNDTEKEESVFELIKNKKWEFIEGLEFTPRDFQFFIENTFSSEENKRKLFNNIVKHKYIVFNDNKTAVYVDIIILYSAISKLFGNNEDIIFNKFAKIRQNMQKSFEKYFLIVFSEELANDRFHLNYFTDNVKCFSGYGIWLTIDSFKTVFNTDEEFDFFRSYQLSNYKVSTKKENCKSRLISNKDNLIL